MIKQVQLIRIDSLEEKFRLKTGALSTFAETHGLTLYSINSRLFASPKEFDQWMKATDRTKLLEKFKRKSYFAGPLTPEQETSQLNDAVKWFTEQFKAQGGIHVGKVFQ